MVYKILEARIEYKDNQLSRVTVLVDLSISRYPYCDLRAIFATNKPMAGYTSIQPNEKVSEELLERVAGYGCETVDREEIFPIVKQLVKKLNY